MIDTLPQVVQDCLQTTKPLTIDWEGDNTVYVEYALDIARSVTLVFGKPTGKWRLYACSENLPEGHWARMQHILMTSQ